MLTPLHKEQIRGSSLIKIAALSDYFGWLPSLQGWIKKKETQHTEKKLVNSNKDIISSQGKALKTVKFGYKNKAGIDRVREIEPYETKDGFLWGRERGQQQIKRYFLNKMEKIEPGENTFEPAWEVKVGSTLLKIAGIR